MTFLLHTDLGHDPDDAVALSYLIEHGYCPNHIGITPGFGQQEDILSGIITAYGNTIYPNCYYSKPVSREKEKAYNFGKHKMLEKANRFSQVFVPYSSPIIVDKALIVGPALCLGDLLECDEMFFQGGYSPNSLKPLEKFLGLKAVPSYNPNGAKSDFNKLVESKKIKTKYFIGKNVCHGFKKKVLGWAPKNELLNSFFNELDDEKAMHDVLAAMLFIDKDKGIWEQAKPTWIDGKLTTEPTDEEIYTLIGVKW